jgi:hypothetical protein
MAKLDTYLQAAPEFGGTLHGPLLEPEIRIGSAEDNRVRVPAALGADPQHVRLQRKSQDTFLLVPVERSSVVWLFRPGQARPTAVRGPTVIRPGEEFSLATPAGMRFLLVQREGQRPKASGGGPSAPDAGPSLPPGVSRMGAGLQNEVRRRGYALLLSSWIGQSAQRIWFFVKTRQFLSPVYLMSFAIMASGWLVGGLSFGQIKLAQATASTAQANLEDCEGLRQSTTSSGEATFTELVAQALGEADWAESLEWPELQDALKDELRLLLDRDAPLFPEWYAGVGSDYEKLAKVLENKGMPPSAARLLAWSGVRPTEQRPPPSSAKQPRWSVRKGDSEFDTHCVRGPFYLSYRQASAVDLTPRLDDVYFEIEGKGSMLEEHADIEAQVNLRRQAVGEDFLPVQATKRPYTAATGTGILGNTAQCLYLPGDDRRDSMSSSAEAIAAVLGANTTRVPAVDEVNGLSGRVALLFAMDVKGQAWKSIDIKQSSLRAAFDPLITQSPADAAYVAHHTAKVIARAIALPCRLLLASNTGHLDVTYQDPPPSFEACAILQAKVDAKRL